MNYERETLLDRLAGEYVLGTLRGAARRRFQGLIGGSLTARRAVYWWERRLAELAMKLPAVSPPAHVWENIERRIATREQPKRTRSGWWPALAASFALISVGLAAWLAIRGTQVEVAQPAQVAIVADTAAPLWAINAFPERGQLRVRALRAVPIEPNRAYELWMLPTSGAPPVSLGLLPTTGDITLPLNAAAARILAASATLAVSIEPRGGSPTGAPTGPVVFTAPLVQMRG